MRSLLIKKSLPGLPQTNQHLTPKSRSRLRRSGFQSAVQTFFIILFASLGISLITYSGFRRFWCSRRSTAANSVLFHFTSRPPLVDRTILEKIAGLDFEDETGSESGIDFSIPINVNSSLVFSPFLRPPRVTHIPEVQPQAPLSLEMEAQNRFCSEGNGNRVLPPCKFLLPLRITGRGLNARAHLVQLLELARALNRTLVLPNVGKNRVGACRRWRFGVYYDEQGLSSKFDDGSGYVIRQDRFRGWVDSLTSPPSSQLVSLDRTYPRTFPPVAVGEESNSSLDVYIGGNSDTATMFHSQTGCLNKKFPQLDLINPFSPLLFVVADYSKQERNSEGISQALVEKLSGPTLTRAQSESLMTIGEHSTNYDFNRTHISPDVLIVSWNIPIFIFQPHPSTTIRYSPQLRALAARLARRLGSYIAVAWDVETSEGDAVLGCVEALRSALHYVLSSHEQLKIRNIWLAGNLSPSDLVHTSEPFCTSTFTQELFFAPGVKLTGIHQELERMVGEGGEVDDVTDSGGEFVRKQEGLKDAGVLGILDKLVSMKSTVFATASKGCGKTRCVFPPRVGAPLRLDELSPKIQYIHEGGPRLA